MKGTEPPAGVTIYRVPFERMSDLDKFNYECAGQISLFSGFLKEKCDTKPEIGAKLIFHYEGHDYDCIVKSHCGFDFFYVRFISRNPSDDFKDVEDVGGWHVSLRGYKKDWDFPEVLP